MVMEYRRLGRTNRNVSVLGIGAGYLSVVDPDLGTALFQRARDAGINYFDGRYGDSNLKLAPVIRRERGEVFVAVKTNDQTSEGVRRRLEEDLRELDTPYIDLYQLRAYNAEMLAGHLAPGGSVEGLERARAEGLIHNIGIAGHSDMRVLVNALRTNRFDTVLFPLNLVQDEAWTTVVPTARALDVGMAIMKPVATGLLPTELALRWLFSQPISTCVPGVSSMAQLEANLAVAEMPSWTLSPDDLAAVDHLREALAGEVCRGCDERCRPYPNGMDRISRLIAHSVALNSLRNLGTADFVDYRWAGEFRQVMGGDFAQALGQCRDLLSGGLAGCEARCPYGIKITELVARQERRLSDLLTRLEGA